MNRIEKEEFHKQKASRWLGQYLGSQRDVDPQKIDPTDKLIDWGFVHEGHYADLTQAFNSATHMDPDWHGSAITPPALLKGSGGKTREGQIGRENTVEDLAKYLASTTAKTRLSPAEVEQILVSRLTGGHGGVVDSTSSLKGVIPDEHEANLINLDCGTYLAITHYTNCVARKKPSPTVATVASCMSKKFQAPR